eukprot:CAMPEP_0194033174 /NCGR_PEP_ID=MMETSP0009_2-20130614/5952_1 /TAXON_ID=210454 /ORGANISM="Grammatophora oceanica, Strain CCMP 410" /LENGTH=232 /DNA_ID=CAMNT_0038673815 /DNA_START=91 /DNA_END=789 /DNA_ORIENTATION=+
MNSSSTIIELSDDGSWDEYGSADETAPSHDWGYFQHANGTDTRGYVLFVLVSLSILFGCCMYLRPRWFARSASSNAQIWALGEPEEEEPVDPELRAKVLKAIFAEQKASHEDFQFDEEAQSLKWTKKSSDSVQFKDCDSMNPTCSICLDPFEEGVLIVSSECSHIFHRECVMEWVGKKDDCPMCRQPMWDDDKYKVLEDEMRVKDDDDDDDDEPSDSVGGKKKTWFSRILRR